MVFSTSSLYHEPDEVRSPAVIEPQGIGAGAQRGCIYVLQVCVLSRILCLEDLLNSEGIPDR